MHQTEARPSLATGDANQRDVATSPFLRDLRQADELDRACQRTEALAHYRELADRGLEHTHAGIRYALLERIVQLCPVDLGWRRQLAQELRTAGWNEAAQRELREVRNVERELGEWVREAAPGVDPPLPAVDHVILTLGLDTPLDLYLDGMRRRLGVRRTAANLGQELVTVVVAARAIATVADLGHLRPLPSVIVVGAEFVAPANATPRVVEAGCSMVEIGARLFDDVTTGTCAPVPKSTTQQLEPAPAIGPRTTAASNTGVDPIAGIAATPSAIVASGDSAEAVALTEARRRSDELAAQLAAAQRREAALDRQLDDSVQQGRLAQGRATALEANLAVERRRAEELAERLAEAGVAHAEESRAGRALEASLRRSVATAEEQRRVGLEVAEKLEGRLRQELAGERERHATLREENARLRSELDANGVRRESELVDRRELERLATEREQAVQRAESALARIEKLEDDIGMLGAEKGALRMRIERATEVVARFRGETERMTAARTALLERLAVAQAERFTHEQALQTRDRALQAATDRELAQRHDVERARAEAAVAKAALDQAQRRATGALALLACGLVVLVIKLIPVANRPSGEKSGANPTIDSATHGAAGSAVPGVSAVPRRRPPAAEPLPPIDVRAYAAIEEPLVRRVSTSDYRLTAKLRTPLEVEAWIAYQAHERGRAAAKVDRTASTLAAVALRRHFDPRRKTYIQVVVEDLGLATSFDVNTIVAAFALSDGERVTRAIVSSWLEPSVVPVSGASAAVMRLWLEFPTPTQLPTTLSFHPLGSTGSEVRWE